MIVRHLGTAPGFGQNFLKGCVAIGHRADAHGRAISPTVVGLPLPIARPADEGAPVAGQRIGMEILVQGIDIIALVHQAVSDGNGENGVIGKAAVGSEQREVLGLRAGTFVDRTDHVPCNGTQHRYVLHSRMILATSSRWFAWGSCGFGSWLWMSRASEATNGDAAKSHQRAHQDFPGMFPTPHDGGGCP